MNQQSVFNVDGVSQSFTFQSVRIDSGLAYLGTDSGMLVLDLRTALYSPLRFDPDFKGAIDVEGEIALGATPGYSLKTADIYPYDASRVLGSLQTELFSQNASDPVLRGGLGILSYGDLIGVFDVSTPSLPKLFSGVFLENHLTDIGKIEVTDVVVANGVAVVSTDFPKHGGIKKICGWKKRKLFPFQCLEPSGGLRFIALPVPNLIRISPGRLEEGVALDSPIEIEFSEPVVVDSVMQDGILISSPIGSGTGETSISGSLTPLDSETIGSSSAARTFRYIPDNNWSENKRIPHYFNQKYH